MPSDLSSDLKIGNPRMASPSTLYTFIESVQTHEKRHSKAVAIFTQPGQTQTGTGNEKSAPSPSKLNSPPRSVRSPSVADPESTAGHPVDEPRTPKRKRVGEDCNSRTPKPKRAKGPESQKARVEEGDMGGVAVEGEEPRVPPAKSRCVGFLHCNFARKLRIVGPQAPGRRTYGYHQQLNQHQLAARVGEAENPQTQRPLLQQPMKTVPLEGNRAFGYMQCVTEPQSHLSDF